MKTYPITDHIPEPDLLAITPDGAARWLLRNGWEWDGACMVTGNAAIPYVVMPKDGAEDRAKRTARMVEKVAAHHRKTVDAVIAEMQADSRIVAECTKMSLRAPKQAQPTETTRY